MIVTQIVTINGNDFQKTFSDKGFKIKRDGVVYDEAIDPVDTDRVYEETDTPVEKLEDEE